MDSDGKCKIKAEYILPERPRELLVECLSEKDKSQLEEVEDEPEAKKQRLSKSQKRKLKGQNKNRGPTFRTNKAQELCNTLVNLTIEEQPKCERKNCEFLHDIQEYLKIKPKDISDTCYNFQLTGKCARGLACRFASKHISETGRNVIDLEKAAEYEKLPLQTKNQFSLELQVKLRKHDYDFSAAEAMVKYNDQRRAEDKKTEAEKVEIVTDDIIVQLNKREKKTIDFRNKIALSALTTVGNLPFRRICKEFGADITCGEMAMCTSLLKGQPQEWALVKRHHSENLFGVQICGNNPHLMTKCGQMLESETSIDYIEINLGCPIDLVYKEGSGCGLLRRSRILESCVRNLSDILTIPLAIKTRTGVYSRENLAHSFAPQFKDWGASLLTIHGRSREQRYTKVADWGYIRQVAQAATTMPVYGNGDIFSYADYKKAIDEAPELAGVMIGRGALIKPWIFTEIKEQRLWDISSSERFDILKKYRDYGLEHWGSDNKGVENTRRFLLEWLSFLYRYVPVGLLEVLPQKINERPPYYKGRDDLETLMASPSAGDWVKISEMLLGAVPDNFHFIPKHKANSYK